MNADRHILITGFDGSLGAALAEAAQWRGFEFVTGLSMRTCEDVRAARAAVAAMERPPTHAILCHGVNYLSLLGTADPEEDAVHERIVRANVLVPRAIVDALAARGCRGLRLLFITSQTHRTPQRGTSLYCATKAAQTMLMRVTAREMAQREGWVVNALAPGKIADTRMSEMTDAQVLALRGWSAEEADRYALGMVPAGRFTSRDEVALAAFRTLALPDYVCGSTIDMAGGA